VAVPSEEKGSPEETEQFFLELGRMLDSPPLSEEFHERLRQRLKRTPSSTEESAQADKILVPPPSASKAIQSKAGKQSNWWKRVYFFGGAVAALVVLVGYCWLEISNYEWHKRKRSMMSPFEIDRPSSIITNGWHLQEIKHKDAGLYVALVNTIDKIRGMLRDKQVYTRIELMEALEPLVEKLNEDDQDSPSIRDIAVVTIYKYLDSHTYYIDEETLKKIESVIKKDSTEHSLEHENKGQ